MLGAGAEPAWGQRDTGGAGLGPAGLHISVVPPSPLGGSFLYGGHSGASGLWLPKPSLTGTGGKGHSCVHLSRVDKRSEVMG